ncbi:MAG: nucleoside triphosphate pyrophosphohydrolase [Candidatus Margulisiibacteriota bacterium]
MKTFTDFVTVIRQLRGPNGCPWDRKQTPKTLIPYIIEESYELVDAIETGSDADQCEELGDVLLQVVLQSVIAEGDHRFTIDDVIASIHDKMIRRHPHVFGDVVADTAEAVVHNWEQIKQQEKGGEKPSSVLGTFPKHFPALMMAQKVSKKAAKKDFDWDSTHQVIGAVESEIAELKAALNSQNPAEIADELGDCFFALVNVARKEGLDAEAVLKQATQKFIRRFETMDRLLAADGVCLENLSLTEKEAAWQRAKQQIQQAQVGEGVE